MTSPGTTLTEAERNSFDDLALTYFTADAAPRKANPWVRKLPPPPPPDVPVLDGIQAQGDLLFVPSSTIELPYSAQPLAHDAVFALVVSGNGHQLRAQNVGVRVAPVWRSHVLAVIDIAPGAYALVEQPSGADAHAPLGLAPGRWQVRRQSEVTGFTTRGRGESWVSD